MIIMAANAAAVAGSQVFRTNDAPLYIHAFTAMLSLSAFCFVTVIGQMAWYYFSNRRIQKTGQTETVQSQLEEGVEIQKTWWWIW
jgi:hypothetical protein